MSTLEIKSAEPTTVALSALTIDPELQCRARGINKRTVQEYSEAMRTAGVSSFPAVTVFRDSKGVLWLADGFQRCAAAAALRVDDIELPAGHT
ncbi:MAG: hypothetical protein EOO73_34210 [Myxococcales bacterium]|nr:MAG: hypothetical protein EOO73_34210 [Myxococcales bacterium]